GAARIHWVRRGGHAHRVAPVYRLFRHLCPQFANRSPPGYVMSVRKRKKSGGRGAQACHSNPLALLDSTNTFHMLKEKQHMLTYRRFHHGIIGVLSGALLLTAVGCSTPLSKREKGALIGGG